MCVHSVLVSYVTEVWVYLKRLIYQFPRQLGIVIVQVDFADLEGN